MDVRTVRQKDCSVVRVRNYTVEEADVPEYQHRQPVNKHTASLILDYKRQKLLVSYAQESLAGSDKKGIMPSLI